MPPKGSRKPVCDSGSVAPRTNGKHRAEMQLEMQQGRRQTVYGPEWYDEALAQADLEKMRAAPSRAAVVGIAAALRLDAQAEVARAAAADEAVKKKPAQALPQGSVVKMRNGKWRAEVCLGRTHYGPRRDKEIGRAHV